MKAVIFKEFGSPNVLQLTEVDQPIPTETELLVKIYATSVTAEDPKMRSADHSPLLKIPVGFIYGFRKPKKPILGFEFSGIIEAVGSKVTRFNAGDQVFGYTGIGFGAYAEYKCMPEKGLMYYKPENLSFKQAATIINGPLSALAYLKKLGKIEKGQQVLIYGASGSVGTAAVQLAKHFEAEVTAVCSTKNIELVKSLGAAHLIDYTKERLSGRKEKYDMIFDTVGKTPLKDCLKLLKPKGKYLLTEFGFTHILAAMFSSLFSRKKIMVAASNFYWKQDDLLFLKELAEKKQFRPVLDKCFSLENIAEAHQYVESGRKVGNVAVTVQQNGELSSKISHG